MTWSKAEIRKARRAPLLPLLQPRGYLKTLRPQIGTPLRYQFGPEQLRRVLAEEEVGNSTDISLIGRIMRKAALIAPRQIFRTVVLRKGGGSCFQKTSPEYVSSDGLSRTRSQSTPVSALWIEAL